MEHAMVVNETETDEGNGKTITLDCGANTSFITKGVKILTKLTQTTQVQTANGPFKTSTRATLKLKTKDKTVNSPLLVHDNLPQNLLSTTPTVENLGAIVLDTKGARLLPDKTYNHIKNELYYFGRRRNKLYKVPINFGAICLGAQKETGRIA